MLAGGYSAALRRPRTERALLHCVPRFERAKWDAPGGSRPRGSCAIRVTRVWCNMSRQWWLHRACGAHQSRHKLQGAQWEAAAVAAATAVETSRRQARGVAKQGGQLPARLDRGVIAATAPSTNNIEAPPDVPSSRSGSTSTSTGDPAARGCALNLWRRRLLW